MRKGFLFFIFVLSVIVGCNQGNKNSNNKNRLSAKDSSEIQEKFMGEKDSLIYSFVEAYRKQDAKLVNEMIHPELGLAIIFRPGVSDRFYLVDHIDFSKPVPDYYPYRVSKNGFELKYERLPEFDCGTDKWDKNGLFCDSTQNPKQLSDIISFEKEFEPNNYPDSYVKKIYDLESDSYRVILTGEDPLIFHIKKYKGNWYITVLDRAYAGCDA